MTSDITYREKGRSLFLAAIMVLSVVAMSAAFAGGAVADDHYDDSDNYDVGPTYDGTQTDALSPVWAGQEVNITDSDLDGYAGYEIRAGSDPSSDDAEAVSGLGGGIADDNSFSFETEDLDTGFYHINLVGGPGAAESDWDGVVFLVDDEELSTSFDDATVAEGESGVTTTLTFESERTTQVVNVTETEEGLEADEIAQLFPGYSDAELDDDDDVAQFEIDTGGADEIDLDVETDSLDIGDYEFQFDVTDSHAEDNATLEVGDTDSQFEFSDGTFEDQQGNMVNITVETNGADSGIIQLGDAEDDYFSSLAHFEVDDDEDVEQFRVQYNSHVPHESGDSGWHVPSDQEDAVDVTSVDNERTWSFNDDNIPEPLSAGDYELIVGEGVDSSGDYAEIDDDHDRAYFSLTQKSPPEQPYAEIAPGDESIDDMEDYEDVTTTESDTVADGDTLIGVIPNLDTSGAIHTLGALVDGGADLGSTAADRSGISLGVSEANAPDHVATHYNSSVDETWANTDGSEDNPHPLPLEGINLDDYDGNLYVEIDYEEANLTVDETYDATFSIDHRNAYLDDDQDKIEMDMSLSLQEPEVNLDASNAELPAGEADVTGTTNIAPGTEIETNARASGAFSLSEDADVASDGTFAATYDFSGESAGTAFDLDARAPTNYKVGGEDVEDDMESVLTEGGSAPAEGIDVSVDHPSEITDGESADVSATVDNHEDEELTVSVEYSVGGETFEEEVTVAAGESASTDTQTIEGLEVGDHDVSATATADGVDDASYSGTLTVNEESTGDDEDTETDDEDDGDSDGQPGFGVAVALVALLAAAMIALRRQD